MDLEALRTHIDRGFEHFAERLDDLRDIGAQRHRESVSRLESIDLEQRAAASRMSEAHRKLEGHAQQIRNLYRMCESANTAATTAAKAAAASSSGSGDSETLTLGRLKWYLAVYGSGAGTILALMKILHKL